MTAGQWAMLLVLAVIAISLGVAANREWKRADRERDLRIAAENERDAHEHATKHATERAEKAEQEAARLEDERNEALHALDGANVLPMYQPATDARLVALDGGAS